MRLGAAGALWVGIEQAAKQVGHGVDEWREVVAGVGLAGVVSLACSLSISICAHRRYIADHDGNRSTSTTGGAASLVARDDWWQSYDVVEAHEGSDGGGE